MKIKGNNNFNSWWIHKKIRYGYILFTKRGGKGIQATSTKQDDFIENMFVTSTHSTILFFTNRGKVYKLKAYEIPEAGRTAKGTNIVNIIPIENNEKYKQ